MGQMTRCHSGPVSRSIAAFAPAVFPANSRSTSASRFACTPHSRHARWPTFHAASSGSVAITPHVGLCCALLARERPRAPGLAAGGTDILWMPQPRFKVGLKPRFNLRSVLSAPHRVAAYDDALINFFRVLVQYRIR